ncbi:MAG: electron transport complex subunit E [Holophagae bacterium]|nr:electron transport complex subunit E [Holophagae bacterium]
MATEQTAGKLIKNGLWSENPVFVLLLGMCPILGVTSSVENGIGMGVATTFVLVMSNLVISLLRRIIPKKMRIPCFIVIIASFVTIVEMLMQAFTPALYRSLGLFIPLIVVNCIVLGRAEAFASKNGLFRSIVDGIAMGAGFTLALMAMGAVRELLGNGSLLNVNLLGSSFNPVLIMIMPPGAFLTLGFLLALMNWINRKIAARKEV